jgi:hypothetical protein
MTTREWQSSHSDAEIRKSITLGRGIETLMTAKKGALTPGQIEALVGYIRKLGKP